MAAAQQGRKDDDDQKTSWPELVHRRAELAVDVIQKDRPDVDDIPLLPMDTPDPTDYEDTRVILYVYNNNNFGLWVGDRIPVIG